MQGTIVKVAVEEGQQVSEGDVIVVLEAMKMEQPLKAHKAGTVTGLGTQVTAQNVDEGGTPVLQVTVTGSMPVFGLFESPIEWTVHGHAYRY